MKNKSNSNLNQIANIGSNIENRKFPIRVLGIDLGTTNSTVTNLLIEKDSKKVIETYEIKQEIPNSGYTIDKLLPSVVAIINGETFIGEGAKRKRGENKLYKNIFYECKNDIGNQKTYNNAPEGYKNPKDIASIIIKRLHEVAQKEDDNHISKICVTIPASFQLSQKNDTRNAAISSGISDDKLILIDEPVAAFIDYIYTENSDGKILNSIKNEKTILVFDFGGGTCDVAIFKLLKKKEEAVTLSYQIASRYHRLGGGDIDKAIASEILIPQFCKQNSLEEKEIGYKDKTKLIEELLSISEMLKIGICKEIKKLMDFNKYDENTSNIEKINPGSSVHKIKENKYSLNSPKLTLNEFEKIIKMFTDQNILYPIENEYYMSLSVFAPIEDALNRSKLNAEEIDYCLCVGGSSSIPNIIKSLDQYFENAKILRFEKNESLKTCVSRGAALNALCFSAFNKPLISPVCHDGIAILTENGPFELIPAGTTLPFPKSGTKKFPAALSTPQAELLEDYILSVKLLTMEGKIELSKISWDLKNIFEGTPINLEIKFDENYVLKLDASIEIGNNIEAISIELDNPLTNIVNPNQLRVKIDEIEEKIRSETINEDMKIRYYDQLSELYAEIGFKEKSIESLKYIINKIDENNLKKGYYLHSLASALENNQDFANAEIAYNECIRLSNDIGAYFNLALLFRRKNRNNEAKTLLEQIITDDIDLPYLVLYALILKDLKKDNDYKETIKKVTKLYDKEKDYDKWTLGWIKKAFGDSKMLKEIQKKIDEINESDTPVITEEERLPVITPGIVKKDK